MTKIPCDKCEGSGVIEVPPALEETLDSIRRGNQTAPAIHKDLGDAVGVTAINRRLEQLLIWKLVARTRGRNKAFSYTLKKPPTKRKTG